MCQLDRHNNRRRLEGFYLPHYEGPRLPLKNSLLDGESVLDVDPQHKGRVNLILSSDGVLILVISIENPAILVFGCLGIDDQNVVTRTLNKRYGAYRPIY